MQVKPGNDFKFLTSIGNYLVDKKPDIIVNLGDFADMPSLSSYDVGKKSFEGRRYKADIEAAHRAMEALLAPINNYNDRARENHKARYTPRRVFVWGTMNIGSKEPLKMMQSLKESCPQKTSSTESTDGKSTHS